MGSVSTEGGTHVGPGYRVQWSGLIAGSLFTDYVTVGLYPTGTTATLLCYGTKFCNGLAADDLILGWDDQKFATVVPTLSGFTAAGGLVDIVLGHISSGGSTLETLTAVGVTYDPTGFAWLIPWLAYRSLPTGTPGYVNTILAAVRLPLPTLP